MQPQVNDARQLVDGVSQSARQAVQLSAARGKRKATHAILLPASPRAGSLNAKTSGALTLTSEGDETVMCWDWQVRSKGWLRMVGPLFGHLGGRMKRRIWTGLKHTLEDDGDVRSSRPRRTSSPCDPVVRDLWRGT